MIEKSLFRHNSVGLCPNSENPGDGPPPQDGECNRPNIKSNPTPTIPSTKIPRCTIIRNNLFAENNNLTVPVIGPPPIAPWGVGAELPGDYADLVERNTIVNNPNNGVLGLSTPTPSPPKWSETIFFQLAGNRISNNEFVHNGYNPTYSGSAFTGDVTLTGGYGEIFGGPGITLDEQLRQRQPVHRRNVPPKIEGEWGCQNKTTPSPGYGGLRSRPPNSPQRSNTSSKIKQNPKRGAQSSDSRLRRHSRPCRTRAKEDPRTHCAREALVSRAQARLM